jgi:hypothetical protein
VGAELWNDVELCGGTVHGSTGMFASMATSEVQKYQCSHVRREHRQRLLYRIEGSVRRLRPCGSNPIGCYLLVDVETLFGCHTVLV